MAYSRKILTRSEIEQLDQDESITLCAECNAPLDPATITNQFELCDHCFAIPSTHSDWPVDSQPCPHPAGSPEKVQWMIDRVARGLSPTAPIDKTYKEFKPGCIQPQEDAKVEVFALPVVRVRGVSRYKTSRHDKITKLVYRARTELDGKRHNLGSYETYEEAAAVAKKWWVEKLGLFWGLGGKMWFYRQKGAKKNSGNANVNDAKKKRKRACQICAYHARFRNRILGKRRMMPAKDGGIFA